MTPTSSFETTSTGVDESMGSTTAPFEDQLTQVEMQDALLDWTVVGGSDPDVSPPAEYDGTYLLRGGSYETVVLLDEESNVVWSHDADSEGGGWLLDSAVLGSGFVAISEHEETEGDYRLWLYKTVDGSARLVEQWEGVPYRHLIPQPSVSGHWLAWDTTKDDETSCILVENVSTGERFEAVCTEDHTEVVTRHEINWPYLTYRLQPANDYEIEPADPCLRLYVMELSDGQADLIEFIPCHGFQAAAGEGLVVWSESRPLTGDVFRSPVYGRDGEGKSYYLGLGALGSIASCAGRAYWKTILPEYQEIRTWAPGEPIGIIYRSPPQWEPTTLPHCNGEWLTVVRAYVGVGEPVDEIVVAPVP